MSGEFNTSDSKFKAQMSYRYTGKKAQTSCVQIQGKQRKLR